MPSITLAAYLTSYPVFGPPRGWLPKRVTHRKNMLFDLAANSSWLLLMFVLLQLRFHANVPHFGVVFPTSRPRLAIKLPEKVCNTWQFLAATWPVLISCFLGPNFKSISNRVELTYFATLPLCLLPLFRKVYIFAWKARSRCQKNIFNPQRIFVFAWRKFVGNAIGRPLESITTMGVGVWSWQRSPIAAWAIFKVVNEKTKRYRVINRFPFNIMEQHMYISYSTVVNNKDVWRQSSIRSEAAIYSSLAKLNKLIRIIT